MITDQQRAFAVALVSEAKASEHPWPGYAAAEACLESSWGASLLAQRTNNLFGLKKPEAWTGEVVSMRTDEDQGGEVVSVPALWPVFSNYSDCLNERLNVLRSAEIYAEALWATTGEEFVRLVSAAWRVPAEKDQPAQVQKFMSGDYVFVNSRWSTDPFRASKVMATFHSHPEIFGGS